MTYDPVGSISTQLASQARKKQKEALARMARQTPSSQKGHTLSRERLDEAVPGPTRKSPKPPRGSAQDIAARIAREQRSR